MEIPTSDTTKVETKLKYWARQLHDMSGRNRLLFWKSTKSSSATIEIPEFNNLFEFLVEKGGGILAPMPEPKGSQLIFDLDNNQKKRYF